MLLALETAINNLFVRAAGTLFFIQPQVSGDKTSYNWIIVLVIAILIIAGLFAFMFYRGIPQRLHILAALKAFFSGKSGMDDPSLKEIADTAGYSYDPLQDIFYSNLNPWQKEHGYCRLYDESAALWGMIIDCEPIYFEYEGKRWLIELWKGQYDLTTGAEVGVYTTEGPDLNIPGVFNGTFYNAASYEDTLDVSFVLKKNGKTLFTRNGRHWWLTGFKLGEYSEPSELTLITTITLKNKEMRNVFVQGLRKAGYQDKELVISGCNVTIRFSDPHTPQPYTRTKQTDELIQIKNKLLCDKYQEITAGYNNFPDKFKAIQEKSPELFKKMTNIGRVKESYDKYEKIKYYIH